MRNPPNEAVGTVDPDSLTGPPRRRGATPERTCVLSRTTGARAGLIRLVAGPDGTVWPDLAARLPGRGAWVAPDRALLGDALASGRLTAALARSLQAPVRVPDDLVERIAAGLERRALDRLGLEHRAGHLLFGTEKLLHAARAGRLHLLLHAADAAGDGRDRLDQAFRSGGGDPADCLVLPAGRDALSRALGRENMVHSGVTDGRAASRIATELARWLAFTGTRADDSAGRDRPGRRNDEGRA